MTSGPTQKILLGCVAENNHKYLSQALRLVRSVRWFGGALKDTDIVVVAIEGLEPAYRLALENLGALYAFKDMQKAQNGLIGELLLMIKTAFNLLDDGTDVHNLCY